MKMTQNKKTVHGCLWLILMGLGTILFTPLLSLINLPSGYPFFTALILSYISIRKVWGRPQRKSLVTAIVSAFALSFLFVFVVIFFLGKSSNTEKSFTGSEHVQRTYIYQGADSVAVYTSNRLWRGYYGKTYTGALTIREPDFLAQQYNKTKYDPLKADNFWGGLYAHLSNSDTPYLDLVLHTFEDIGRTNTLNRLEFAEMVVSCIQDIPYAYIFSQTCEDVKNSEPEVARFLKSCPACCKGEVGYGVQCVLAFLQGLKGDCDTRTVILYSILKHFNYDVAILNSDFYRHSILGVNIPASGDYKLHRGKRYYLWETTAKYFKIGEMAPRMEDLSHWDIVLLSK